jgi:hypothetical protein
MDLDLDMVLEIVEKVLENEYIQNLEIYQFYNNYNYSTF